MSYRRRAHIPHGLPGYIAVAYDEAGVSVASMGPYLTRGPAMAQRRDLLSRPGAVMACVEVATPIYIEIAGTEITRGEST